MNAWPATSASATPAAPQGETPAQDLASPPWPIQQQLAQILVNTILEHVQEILL
jgi:hypothetical protein